MSEVVRLMRHELQLAGVEINLECADDLPAVLGSRDQLHQVVLNLVLNAIAVTPSGGSIDLVASETSGGSLRVQISDSGPGIPEAHLEQVFEPFFTTRGTDGGSGLGLMVCHRIVSDHGGSIEATNLEAGGARFILEFPRTSSATDAPA
jgi:signal transduction histidine kinase